MRRFICNRGWLGSEGPPPPLLSSLEGGCWLLLLVLAAVLPQSAALPAVQQCIDRPLWTPQSRLKKWATTNNQSGSGVHCVGWSSCTDGPPLHTPFSSVC